MMLENLLGLGITLLIAGVIYLIFRSKISVTKAFGYNYNIVFKNMTDFPELESDRELRKNLRIVAHTDDMYSVQSKLNDKTLKDYLMKTYQLQGNQVYVQPTQLSGAYGMM